MFDCITGKAVVTDLRAWQIGVMSVAVSWVSLSPAPPGGYYVVITSENYSASANVKGTAYNATVSPGRYTIYVQTNSLHYPTEEVSVEITVHEIGKDMTSCAIFPWCIQPLYYYAPLPSQGRPI